MQEDGVEVLVSEDTLDWRFANGRVEASVILLDRIDIAGLGDAKLLSCLWEAGTICREVVCTG